MKYIRIYCEYLKILKCEYYEVNGKKEGEYKEYDIYGNLKNIFNYSNGLLTGVSKQYYQEGGLSSVENYVKSKKIGECNYYINGNIFESLLFSDGSDICKYKRYYYHNRNGILNESGHVIYNPSLGCDPYIYIYYGMIKFYDENGEFIEEKYYDHRKCII